MCYITQNFNNTSDQKGSINAIDGNIEKDQTDSDSDGIEILSHNGGGNGGNHGSSRKGNRNNNSSNGNDGKRNDNCNHNGNDNGNENSW